MTNDKIYASIVEMLRCYERETGREDGGLDKLVKDTGRLQELAAFTACENIYASAARVLLDLREKMDKKATGAGRVAVCKRLVNNCSRPGLAGIREQEGRYCIVDGYRLFRFSEDLPSIQRAKYEFDYNKVIPQDPTRNGTMQAPSRADIRAYIAETGATRSKPPKKPFFLLPWYAVNPFYLLDILDAVPDAVFYVPECYNKPLYFADDNGNDGILLPVFVASAREAWEAEQDRKSMIA